MTARKKSPSADRPRSPGLHGSVVHRAKAALLLIDVINDLEFPEGEQIRPHAMRMARAVARLKARASAAGVPTVYVNDNFGIWKSDFRCVVEHCLRDGVRGAPVARMLAPTDGDYFVLKPKHSGFYSTTLDLLLAHLGARTLILVGLAGNICVLFTANDAYMRDYELCVPGDCCASNTVAENRHALAQMKAVLKADTRPSSRLDLAALAKGRDR
jgi:nicotinamidase-related amidase